MHSLKQNTLFCKNALSETRLPSTSDNIEKCKDSSDQSFYLVVTHNPSNPLIRDIIENNWPLLNKSQTTRTLENANIVFGLRRNKNLADHLIQQLFTASIKSLESPSNITKNLCKRTHTCRYCPIINQSGSVTSSNNGRKFNCLIIVTCQSSNLI